MKIKGRRLSKFQRTILETIKAHGKKCDHEELRDKVMEVLKIDWVKEESFKASFSRSLKNLKEKRLIHREDAGFYFGRHSLLWEDIRINPSGLKVVSDL